MYLLPNPEYFPPLSLYPESHKTSLQYFSAYDLPSVEVIVCYFHADAGLPVRNTWLQATKAGNFASWPGLTYQNAAKSCPIIDEIIKGDMVQVLQVVQSTKSKP